MGWLLLLGALGAAFTAQAAVGRTLGGDGDLSPDVAGSIAPWLIVAGLGVIGFGVLIG